MNGVILSFTVAIVLGVTSASEARPENPKPGRSYYAEDYATKDGVSEIGTEKNFEEVFKNYEYFESVYDEKGRPVIFRVYKKSELVLTEYYFYDSDGRLEKKKVEKKE